MFQYESEIVLGGAVPRVVYLKSPNLRRLLKDCRQYVQDYGERSGGSRGGFIVRYPIIIGDKMDVTDVDSYIYLYNAEKDKFVFKRDYLEPCEFLHQPTK
jgi:hypothetical protein